jgi:hypothetical protein
MADGNAGTSGTIPRLFVRRGHPDPVGLRSGPERRGKCDRGVGVEEGESSPIL